MQVMIFIILPQAYKNIIPTLLSQVITTIKDSSYLANVAIIELMARIKKLLSVAHVYNGTGNIMYLMFCALWYCNVDLFYNKFLIVNSSTTYAEAI